MLKGMPDKTIFEKLSIRLFMFCLDQLYLFDEYLTMIPEMEEDDEKDIADDYIKGNQVELYAILILLFQSMENYLKKEICKESPYLVIASNPKEWKDKNFNSLFLHGFDSLLKIYSEIKKKNISKSLLSHMNKLKNLRNSIVHGVYAEHISPEEITNYIFIFLNNFWGGSWLDEIRVYVPYEEQSGSESIALWKYFYLFKRYLSKDKICTLLDIRSDQLFCCPTCTHLNESAHYLTDKCDLAYFLDKRKNGKQILFCPICQNEFYLEGLICSNKECSSNKVVSNVDWGSFCLDCQSFIPDV